MKKGVVFFKGNNIKGFSKIELALVLCIIVLLFAILTPVYMKFAENMSLNGVISETKILLSMIDSYYFENDEYPKSLADIEEFSGEEIKGEIISLSRITDKSTMVKSINLVYRTEGGYMVYYPSTSEMQNKDYFIKDGIAVFNGGGTDDEIY